MKNTKTKATRSNKLLWQLILSFVVLCSYNLSLPASDLTLLNDFIEQHKNRTTIAATFTAVKSHTHAKPASEDGDIHAAGTAPEIQLTTVAEIMNAKHHQNGISLLLIQ